MNNRMRSIKDGIFNQSLICQSTIFNNGDWYVGKDNDLEATAMAGTR